MYPHKTIIFDYRATPEELVTLLNRRFGDDTVLSLTHQLNIEDTEFTLVKKRSLFNPFERKIVFGEIRGAIAKNQIIYDIRVSNIMKGIILVDAILLIAFGLFQLLDNQFQLGLLILGVTLIFALVAYFWITIEIHYLEKILKKEIQK